MKGVYRLLTVFFIFLFTLSGCSGNNQPKNNPSKVYRVGIMCGAEPFVDIADGFKVKMKELGYAEGKNIIYLLEKTTSDSGAELRVARDLVMKPVDLIFAFPADPAFAAKIAARGKGIPVVFAMAGIEGTDLVENLRRPGGNITGVRFPNPELTAKRFEILHELVPNAKRIYIIYDPKYPNAPFALEVLRAAASAAGISLVEDLVGSVEEYQAALQKRALLSDAGIDAVFLMPDILNHSPDGFGALIKFANEHKLPVGGGMDFTADQGAMFSFVPGNIDQGKLAAILVDKIFKGADAGSIPVVTPEARLRLNYKVIQEMGLQVPAGLLNRADEILR